MTRARAEEFRRLAQQCRELARSLSTKEARVVLVDMAAHWLRLAEQQEKGTDIEGPIPPSSTAESQPAAQQQQQVQPKKTKTLRQRPERLQVMLSADEIAAIEDFQYQARMPSRAAAVRELLRRGLASVEEGD